MNASHLVELRAELGGQGLQGLLVPRADEHLGETVPPCSERLAWLTGFTGSAGLAVVLADQAAVFTDGRYVQQLSVQTDAAHWERLHVQEQPPWAWLARVAGRGARIGYDPMLLSEDQVRRYADAGLDMVALAANPMDALWTDRPPPPTAIAVPHPLAFAGRASADKRAEVAERLRADAQDAAVLTDPASIAWLLNLRGSDLPTTPVALGFAIMRADGGCDLFMAPGKVPPATRAWLGNAVAVHDRAALAPALTALAGKTVRVDGAAAPAWFAQTLRAAGATVALAPDPCLLPKARKNEAERAGARAAHRRDAVALCRFLHWMEQAAGRETEASAAARLHALRAESPEFRGDAFEAISGAGENAAIVHYRVTEASDRAIRPNELYLVDSGGQYPDGTTDVTRTIWTGEDTPPPELRDRFTRVLKGHAALATLVFPHGTAGPHVDALARVFLWQEGLDFDHGVGHGVGSYLSVHEGPVGLSRRGGTVPIEAGMILSNEPGFYLPGQYGIRLENLELVVPADASPDRPEGAKPFLRFEPLTLAPFDRRLVDPALLGDAGRAWLDTYHARVLAEVSPLLPPDTAAWLARACARLG